MNSFFTAFGATQSPFRVQPQVIVMGNFDGVHLGHQVLLKKARDLSLEKKQPGVVVTFEPHPMAILRPPHLRLFDLGDQQRQFQKAGLQGVVYLAFSRDFSELTAEQFLETVLFPEFKPAALVVGFNFRFGAGRLGTAEMLQAWGKKSGCEVHVIAPFELTTGPVSTSEIRKALQVGNVVKANELLGRPFYLSGIVVHGDSRGRGIGFPTANLHLEKVVTPKWGVYATRTWLQEKCFESVTHLGPLPTFEDAVVRLETHLLDFEGDLYGQTLRVEFIESVREVKKFNSIQELTEQIGRDVVRAREILGRTP